MAEQNPEAGQASAPAPDAAPHPVARDGRAQSRWRWRLFCGVAATGVLMSLLAATDFYRREAASPYPVACNLPFPPLPGTTEDLAAAALDRVGFPEERRLRSGDTLQRILLDLGLAADDAHRAATRALLPVGRQGLRAGEPYLVFFGQDVLGRRVRPLLLQFVVPGRGRLEIERKATGWDSRFQAFERTTKRRMVRATLRGDLGTSLEANGASPLLAQAMADVLQWDLDFNRDLQPEDRFEVLFDEVFLDGVRHGVGVIHALRYQAGSRTLESIRYHDGYYDPQGRPLKRQFLRSPLPYSRVTSRFSSRRFHPVLKTHRPHWGVDYGAPVGTPVRATAAGAVEAAAWSGGGGKTITLRHGNGYRTSYLHLSRFAQGLHRGLRVAQGQVIGYVGATGLASGPHLDYRVQQNGRYLDPLTIGRGERLDPIAPHEMASFAAHRDRLRAELTGEPDGSAGDALALAGAAGSLPAARTAGP